MNKNTYDNILNKHTIEQDKDRIKKLINSNRIHGVFRPIRDDEEDILMLNSLYKSRTIRFGGALEEIIREILVEIGYIPLNRKIKLSNGRAIEIDGLFEKCDKIIILEIKLRDDHDTNKRRGDINDFFHKIDIIKDLYDKHVIAIKYFIDPDFTKNRLYYLSKIDEYKTTDVDTYLLYGKELFEHLKILNVWDDINSWQVEWKNSIPSLTELSVTIEHLVK